MEMDRLWVGLIAFCIGLVLLFNLGTIFPYNSTTPLLVKMSIETIVAILIFGGIILVILHWKPLVKPEAPKQKPVKLQ